MEEKICDWWIDEYIYNIFFSAYAYEFFHSENFVLSSRTYALSDGKKLRIYIVVFM